jgi:hypothetical protein
MSAGSENFGESSQLLPEPINGENHVEAKPPGKTYNSFFGYAIAVNYIIGTGAFGYLCIIFLTK